MLPASVLAATLLVLCALVALASRSGLHGIAFNSRVPAQTATARRTTPLAPPPMSGGSSSHASLPHWIGWSALGIVAALLAAVVLRHLPALHLARGSSERATEPEPEPDPSLTPSLAEERTSARQEALREAVLRSLEEIRRDPDARRAIIGAYRLMEDALARTGLPRGAAEAPREYLARALASIEVGPQAPRRLTALFERARFADDELELTLRDEAVAALLELQESL
jgi:uncharacterized protein DUF4129